MKYAIITILLIFMIYVFVGYIMLAGGMDG